MMGAKYTKILLIIIFILNILDAIFTFISVKSGMAYEINPLANILLARGPFVFFSVKIGIGALLLGFLYFRVKKDNSVHTMILLILACFMMLLVTFSMFASFMTLMIG